MNRFNQLYNKYKADIYKYLFYLSSDSYIAEDLTQETFIRAYKPIHRFKGKSKVSTWLFQIAKFTFYDYLRDKKKNNKIIDNYKDKVESITNTTPHEIYNQKEESTTLLKALNQLKQPQQHIVILRIYNELSYKEIGEIFNQSEIWARVNFYRAKNTLGLLIERGVKE